MITPHDRDRIRKSIDARDIDALRGLAPAVAAAFLDDLLAGAERTYPQINEDWIATQVRLLRFADHGDLDRVALTWLDDAPSAARLDLASVALQNLWLRGQNHRAAAPELVESLLAARAGIALTPASDASSIFALALALRDPLPPETHRRVLDVMAEASTRKHEHPAVPTVVAQALASAGMAPGNRSQ